MSHAPHSHRTSIPTATMRRRTRFGSEFVRGRRRPAAGGQFGFSLLELLVGLMLFTALVWGAYAGLRTGARSWQAAEERIETTEEVRVVSQFLRDRLSQAIAYAIPDASRWRVWFDGGDDRLEFLSHLPAHLGNGGAHQVRFERVRKGDREQLVVVLEPLGVDSEPGTVSRNAVRKVLVDDLAELELSYYGAPTKRTEPRWRESWKSAQRLPRLVRVRIGSRLAGKWPELEVAIVSDALQFRRRRRGEPRPSLDEEDGDEPAAQGSEPADAADNQ